MHQKHRNINKYLKLEAEGLEGSLHRTDSVHRGTDLLVSDGGQGGSFVFVLGVHFFPFSLFVDFFFVSVLILYNQFW